VLYNDNFWHEDAQMNMPSPACLINKKSKTGTSLFLFLCYCLLSNRQQRKFIMVFSKEDQILIQNLYEFKGYGAKRLIKEFPQKGWKLRGLNYLLKRLRETGTTDRLPGSGRPRTSRTAENIEAVNNLVLSQDDAPRTHKTTRQIARELVISRRSVGRIIHEDLQLKCLKKRRAQELTAMNCETRLDRSRQLLRKYPSYAVDFIFFTDEKVFTVAPPVNLQNDRVYAPVATKKRDIVADRLLRTRSTFSKSVMVSVAVSKLGCTGLIFVEPGVKVNGQYYREFLLTDQLLPAIRRIAGDIYTFQQDSAPAHRARETIELLQRETPDFITPDLWPPNSPDLNPVDYRIWGILQERVYRKSVKDVDELKLRLIEAWSGIQQSVIDHAIDQWRVRLNACVKAKGKHFEHML
jgi:inhibitor of nuclear factor kappa-B kinase subunit alpha